MGILYALHICNAWKYAWKSKMCVASQHTDNTKKSVQHLKENEKEKERKKTKNVYLSRVILVAGALCVASLLLPFCCNPMHCSEVQCARQFTAQRQCIHSIVCVVHASFVYLVLFGLFKKRNTHICAWLRMKTAQPES